MIRSFSTKSSNPNNTNNLDLDKGRILQENKLDPNFITGFSEAES